MDQSERDAGDVLRGGGGSPNLFIGVVEQDRVHSSVCDQDWEEVDDTGKDWQERYLGGSADTEQRAFQAFARTMRALQARTRGAGNVTLRGLHARMLAGTSEARLVVHNSEQQGGFLRNGGSYPVTLRFSSASSRQQPDPKRDLRGIALRVSLPEGACDLLLTNAETSHVRDADEFMAFASAMANLPLGPLALVARRPVRGVSMFLAAARQTGRPARSLAAESFWSRAPFLLGGQPVRYELRPVGRPEALALDVTSTRPDYLFEDLACKLDRDELRFDLYVQPFLDEARTPLEDASRRWSSVPRRVATLFIARQALPERHSAAFRALDALTFNPWNTLPSMRPLGSLNRARRAVYAASQEERTRPAAHDPSPLGQRLLDGMSRGFSLLNKVRRWDRLTPWLGVANLIALRNDFRQHSLRGMDNPTSARPLPTRPDAAARARSYDGRFNDLVSPHVGACGARFGRNGSLALAKQRDVALDARLHEPDPRAVSEQLLKRDAFLPAPTLNLLAVAWIQFQVHDWFRHKEQTAADVPMNPRDALAEKLGVFPTLRSEARTALDRALPTAFENEVTHWWDCSQLYGSSPEEAALLRTDEGLLRLDHEQLLLIDEHKRPVTGSHKNWWVGLEVMHTVFAREHNAICQALRNEYPSWTGERLFEVARLINVAVMDKIHTVEWTPTVLGNETLKRAMSAHWYGLAPKLDAARGTTSELLSGIPGSPTEQFEVPYALTEEFVSVYRLHPMLPDRFSIRTASSSPDKPRERELGFEQVALEESGPLTRALGLSDLTFSLASDCAGRMCLNNYPAFLRDLPPRDGRKQHIDLAAVDIFRDRERGVARYNDFRAQFGLPKKRSFSELSDDPETRAKLERLYGTVDRVDLLVGLLAETPPEGFGISDTAFRVFIGMASRRLKGDRFITADYREALYTRTGLAWVEQSSFKSVLLRHLPALHHVLRGVSDPFAPWESTHAS